MYAKTTFWTAAAAALFQLAIVNAEKQTIEYTFTPGGEFDCNAGALNRTCGPGDPYGGCVYAPEAETPSLWCCPAGDLSCWGWSTDCKSGSKQCKSDGNSKPSRPFPPIPSHPFPSFSSGTNPPPPSAWCCDAQYEECEYTGGKVNLCLLRQDVFPNPQAELPAKKEFGDKLDAVSTKIVVDVAAQTSKPSASSASKGSSATATATRSGAVASASASVSVSKGDDETFTRTRSTSSAPGSAEATTEDASSTAAEATNSAAGEVTGSAVPEVSTGAGGRNGAQMAMPVGGVLVGFVVAMLG
ncbi:hypothetical protein BZA05DRAFT_403631 [Tricharina praecox]|uniref:uncharacterized protein n=1 Tax=Tricharina praecox TaxID=43433 RepID=UPI002220ED28|nr:uncharacterized protein BZA05DRAFT_403631 [Tricharina praecox]KAI5848309.1 hypothetical protein BZA05DRAFT_403631 [Tricharina praecox]